MGRTKHQQRSGTCAYCGAVGLVESEHVFPRVIFRKLDPQMVTVSSCRKCNERKGLGDRDLRNYLTLNIASSDHPDALWHAEQMVKSNVRTRIWLERTIKTAKRIPLVDENGLVFDYALEINFDNTRLLNSLAMSIRGLYFHVTGQILPAKHPVSILEVSWSDSYNFMRTVVSRMPGEITEKGNQVVWWKHNFNPDDPTESIWILCFSNRLAFIGTTGGAAVTMDAKKEISKARTEAKRLVEGLILSDESAPIRIPRSTDGSLQLPGR